MMLVTLKITSFQGSPRWRYFYSTSKNLFTTYFSSAIMDDIYPCRKRLTLFQLNLLCGCSRKWDNQSLRSRAYSNICCFLFLINKKTQNSQILGLDGTERWVFAEQFLQNMLMVFFLQSDGDNDFFSCSLLDINAALQFSH